MTSDPSEQAAVALRGYREAVARYNTAAPKAEEDDIAVLLPVIEALWWARAVDERFAKMHPDTYHQSRLQDPNGQVLRGVRYIRNRCGHEQALVVIHDDARLPLRLPMYLGKAVRWKRLADLPPAESPDENGERHYELRLAGDTVGQTFDRISAWFDTVTAHPPK